MDDLYPSELEVLYGSLTVLLREEKDIEKKISENTKQIKEYVHKEIAPTSTDVSQCSTEELSKTENPMPAQEKEKEEEEESASSEGNKSEPHIEEEEINVPAKEPLPIVKKLFKQVALLCHPDKVKDEKLHKFFLLGRTAQDDNDILTLLFILSRCSADVVLKDAEIAEIKELMTKRHEAILKKKESVCYKWNTYSDDVKKILIKQIIPK